MKKLTFILEVIFAFASYHGKTQSLNTKLTGSLESIQNLPENRNTHRTRPGNGNDTIVNSYYKSLLGLNYVSASTLTETRTQPYGFNTNGTGFPSTVTIAGLPARAVIDTAFVYIAASYTEAIAPPCTITITNPSSIVNTYSCVTIGTGGSVCWGGEVGTVAYRTGINPSIAGNGNYQVNINGLANPDWEVDGVTLFLTYIDPSSNDTGTVILADGCKSYGMTRGTYHDIVRGFTGCTTGSSGGVFFDL